MFLRPLFFFLFILLGQYSFSQSYTPSPSNLEARKWFSDAKFGLFIHWGPFSIPGSGEWVMNDRKINVKNYTLLERFFNPTEFNAEEWVTAAKKGGMKYITLITRHHDGFSLWDTKYSDFNIMNTQYKKDIVKLVADECRKQDMKLFLYYSLLDWRREDYPYETGRTGQHSGRTGKGDYASYLQFMKNQLTELLTNYGEIAGVWFDGHWDQTAPEGQEDRTSKIDWKYEEIYGLIHQLQPQCLIGNNHHLSPLPGEDFQMFERDLPGENKSGLSFQQASDHLPIEACETINGSWGFNLSDTTYKSPKQLIEYLVKAAGLGSNLLLNIGPMPNGEIQSEFKERLDSVGSWLETYGESVYGTSAGYIAPQSWGCLTQKGNKVYVHVFNNDGNDITLNKFPYKKIKKAYSLADGTAIKVKISEGNAIISSKSDVDELNHVIVLETAD
ncbi:alpha-L-fucosidase [Sphingobacterium sp. lm-10]|uniref:alpha-L-fucosidase n=1 Tax=Sphingobacterium sp. lm-10 TaxID=2944904 RepID=UPI002021BF89|nr:alpha-L-fucosidase [Sphingobacterium sp. lm-10]MCL7989192.1 alpha-L-fucosidase [Sphingobacterium sp. lm-10]